MKRSFILMLTALTLGTSVFAQSTKTEQPAKPAPRRSVMPAKPAVRLANALQLDDKTEAWFIPLYNEYCDSLRSVKLQERKWQDKQQPFDPKALNDKEALEYIENGFDCTEKTVAVKRAYYSKFKKHLTPQQLVTIFGRNDKPQTLKFKNKSMKPNHHFKYADKKQTQTAK